MFWSIFCVLGDNGDILHWRFTRGQSFDEVRDIFADLRSRFITQGIQMDGIIIDNCCAWSGMFSSVLPGVPVKLDLFHAVQRVLSVLPRDVRVMSGVAKEYGFIFHQLSDLGENRRKHTPDSSTIIKNLDSFLRKWSPAKWNGNPVLDSNTMAAINKLKHHISKGCLSHIPPHCSTSRNEI